MKAYQADVVFDGERFLDDGALVVVDDDGLIAGVETPGATLPHDLEVVHAPGATLLPGLIDTHTHLCCDSGPTALDRIADLGDDDLHRIVAEALAQQLVAGVTTVRDLGDRDWFVAERRATPAGLPRVLAAGPPITVQGGHCAAMGGAVPGPYGGRIPALRAAVRERAERHVDVVKIMSSGGLMTPGTDPSAPQFDLAELRAVVETAHDLGLPVTAHAHALDAVRNALAAGVDGIEHCSCMTLEGPSLPDDVLAAVAASQVAVCPTAGRVSEHPAPRIQELMDHFHLTFEGLYEQFGALWRAGARLVGGADSGISPDKPHGVMPWAVAEFLEYGMSVTEALAAATSVAADSLGLTAVTGRLRPRLAADLVVVPADLRQGLEPLRTPSLVVARGVATNG